MSFFRLNLAGLSFILRHVDLMIELCWSSCCYHVVILIFYVELLIKIEFLDSFVLHPARFNQTVWLNLARFNLILMCLALIFCYVDVVMMWCCIFLFVIVVYLSIFVFFVIVLSISACMERLIYCDMVLSPIDRHVSFWILLTELTVDWFSYCRFCLDLHFVVFRI